MKYVLTIVLALVCFSPFNVFPVIIESDKLASTLSYADKDTWILFDIDNTLMESSLQLGSAQWRSHVRKKALLAGCDSEKADEVLDKFWFFVQHFIPVNVVDPATLSVLGQLQESSIVLALTAREPHEKHYTQKQLHSLGIDLRNNSFSDELALSRPFPCLYQEGIIYCGENKKSAGLAAFFDATRQLPKKVIFVDDKQEQIDDVENALNQMGIECIAIRFGGADERVKSFNPSIADIQWNHLPRIISDQEASELQKQN